MPYLEPPAPPHPAPFIIFASSTHSSCLTLLRRHARQIVRCGIGSWNGTIVRSEIVLVGPAAISGMSVSPYVTISGSGHPRRPHGSQISTLSGTDPPCSRLIGMKPPPIQGRTMSILQTTKKAVEQVTGVARPGW
ncbi:hypothetical protein NKI41_00290 [Mesorhizobium sp. M0601]|uniref:hypothetical protein n=1 Tax=Mesorhizobium sp. M0601 TaxID=2956969 RepID=UPI00333D7A7B